MGRNAPESPSNTKKRRRNNAASAAAAANTAVSSSSGLSSGPGSSGPGDLAPPPPMTGYGDTVYASNPFDDMTPMGPSPVMGRGRPPSTGPQSQFMMGSAGMPVANGMTPPGSLSGMYGANAGPMGYPMTQVGGMPMPNGMPGPGGPMLPGSVQVPMAGGPGGPMMSGPGVPMTMGSMAGNMGQMMGASPAGMGPTPPSDLCGPMPMVPSGPMGPAGKLGMGGGGPGGVSPSPSVTAAMHSSRKVYPPDQPMVFNPQNPNAPPIYPCGMCHKEVHENDQAILCESGCNFWFHRMCTGLIEQAYHLLIAEVYAEWVCDRCLRNKNIPLIKFKP